VILAGGLRDEAPRLAEVSGPVATITLPQSAGGSSAISPRLIVTRE